MDGGKAESEFLRDILPAASASRSHVRCLNSPGTAALVRWLRPGVGNEPIGGDAAWSQLSHAPWKKRDFGFNGENNAFQSESNCSVSTELTRARFRRH